MTWLRAAGIVPDSAGTLGEDCAFKGNATRIDAIVAVVAIRIGTG